MIAAKGDKMLADSGIAAAVTRTKLVVDAIIAGSIATARSEVS